jgi:hypothetical protein
MAFGLSVSSGVWAGSRHGNSHSNVGSNGAKGVAHATGAAGTHRPPPRKTGQAAAKKKGKKGRKIDGDSSDYLVIDLKEASPIDYDPPPKKPQKPQKPQ